MKLTKCIIRGKIPNYNQTVYCSVGEVPDDRNSVLLGYHESLPVMSNKSSCVTTPPKKATLKVEVDPNTGNRFIHLNGKRLRMLYDTEIPLHIKQKVKINVPTPIVGKDDTSSSSKTLWVPKEISNSAQESHVYISNKNGTNSLSQSSLIMNTSLVKVENPKADAIPQTTDNIQINSDKHSNSSTLSATLEPVNKFIIQPVDKMQPIDLTKHDKCIETDRKNFVDTGVQVNIEINENPLLEEFDKLNPYFDLDDILKFDKVFDSRPLTPRKITNSPFPNVPTKQLTNLNTVLQLDTEKQKLAASFFGELRRALIKDDKGNMPIHVGVLTNNLGLVRRSWFILKILKQSVDVLNNNDYTPLQLAIIHNADDNIVTLLAAAEANLGYCDSEGNNIIHLAVEFQRTDALKMLLNYINNIAILDQHNHEGLSPLMMCALSGQLQCADLLLDNGADINLRDQVSGRTALFHAAENMHQDMVQLLLNYGADTKIKNFFGTSPHDAMYDVEDIPEAIKMMILGRSMKRKFVEDVKNSHKLKKKGSELKTYSRLHKISNGNGMMDDVLKRGTVIQIRHVLNGNLKHP